MDQEEGPFSLGGRDGVGGCRGWKKSLLLKEKGRECCWGLVATVTMHLDWV